MNRRSIAFAASLVFLSGYISNAQVLVVQEGLRTHAPEGFFIGGCIQGDSEGFKSIEYRNFAKRDFNAITSTAYLPWSVWPDPSKPPNFSWFTAVADWGLGNGMKVHGHALLYPDANKSADWFQRMPNEKVEPILKYL